MSQSITVRTIIWIRSTLEGAGVHLKRLFGANKIPLFDPFPLLDYFRSNDPARYIAGFP